MDRTLLTVAAGGFLAGSLLAGSANVPIRTGADRNPSPLRVDMRRIGTLRPRAVSEIAASNWTLGCECLDRDFADFDEYRDYLAPLGIKTIRLQAGWAKCERQPGRYDFSWLDHQVDFARKLGLDVLLETDYGNPVYEGGGGWDLAGGFPTSATALAAWDAWVDALTKHFGGRVRNWAMWNEPDIGEPRKTPEDIAAFNIRTARIVRRNVPDARVAGLSLARLDAALFEQCLLAMGADVKLFDEFIYHGYSDAPEKSYEKVEVLQSVLARIHPSARLRQGENGCPSETATRFALSGIPWSEYSQAKWDMRRMLGDLGHDIASSVFTICDFNHRGREINLKGLLRADEEKRVIAVKRAYYAVQNVAGLFDVRWRRVREPSFGTSDATIVTYEYRRDSGEPLYLFWQFAEQSHEIPRRDAHGDVVPGARQTVGIPIRPGDGFATRPHVFRIAGGAALEDPVFVDLLTGGVYAFPKANVCVSKTCMRLLDVPVYDSPCLITERRTLTVDPMSANGQR